MNSLFDQLLRYFEFNPLPILRLHGGPRNTIVLRGDSGELRIVLRDDMTWDYAVDDEGFAKVLEDGITQLLEKESANGYND
jgi:hypothetical protein